MATTHETMPRAEVVNAVCGCETHGVERKAIAVEPSIKVANLKRLRRIEGQIRGLQKMVEGIAIALTSWSRSPRSRRLCEPSDAP